MHDGGRVLRFATTPVEPLAHERVVVLDTTWTAAPGDAAESVRAAAGRVLAARNLFDEATDLLERWADRSGIVELLTIDGTTFWYQRRLVTWWWLQERLLWLAILDDLLRSEHPTAIVVDPGTDPALDAMARLVGARDGIRVDPTRQAGHRPTVETDEAEADAPAGEDEPGQPTTPSAGAAASSPTDARRLPSSLAVRILDRTVGGVRRVANRWYRRLRPEEHRQRRAIIAKRLERLSRRSPAILVLLAHTRQRVETASGSREMDPYLGPIVDELGREGLDTIELDIRSSIDDEATWQRLRGQGGDRLLPADALGTYDRAREHLEFARRGAEVAAAVGRLDTPLVVGGVDLGPSLVATVEDHVRRTFRFRLRNVVRIRRLLRHLRPLGIMLADEYHRTEWLAAARAEGIPTIAVQHGGIQRRHLGYLHATRPDSLTLPDRTYVFGDWERRLLLEMGSYRDEEVHVGGSPRLDLVQPNVERDVAAARRELGVADGNRLVVLSTTWGPLLRRFHFPVSLERLFDRPLPGVHLVVKLHPSEDDDGLYRRVIEGLASAAGFDPPPISVVHRVDLYRLLAAADAHIGLYSTVITEAVFTATPNLLAACVQPNDLLGYLDARVAVPVRDGGELLAALASGAGRSDEATRTAFVEDHFRPGHASRRIATELREWLGPATTAERDG